MIQALFIVIKPLYYLLLYSKNTPLKFDPYKIDLPVTDVITDVKKHLQSENTLIVNAPPGAGKSTLLPLALMNENWLEGQKLIMLEPRRLAARTIAERMAQLLEEKVGESIGYRIRFDNKVGPNTKIEVVTEGILTRMLQSDNALEGVGMIIFDEFHERSLFADVALALSRESQQVLRPDLRLMIMSATLDMPKLTSLLDCSSIVSEGRMFPVEIIYAGEIDLYSIAEMTASTVLKALKEQSGDVLVFLPGEGEIKKCAQLLKSASDGVQIHLLYGQLNAARQYAAIMPDKQGRRKVVLATSIAETSLTIEGINVVVDCGFGRTLRFNPSTGLSSLETIEISKDSADQRAGRAGRLAPGVCYRLWNKAIHERKAEHRRPEIEEADLASLVLDMAQWGVADISRLCWLSHPPKGHIKQASELLHQLDALDDNKLTVHGKAIHRLPCHPRIAHMLIMAETEGLSSLACDIAALLEERDPLSREDGIDINKRIEALRRMRQGALKSRKLSRIEQIAAQYRRLLNVDFDNSPVDPFETGLVLVFAYPERIAHAKRGNNAQFKLANGNIAAAGKNDDLAYESWLSVAHMNASDKVGKIFLASPLNPQDLASMVKTLERVNWDTKRGGFSAVKEMRIGHIVLQSRPLQEYDSELKIKAICKAIEKEGEWLLDFNEGVKQWQNRVLSVRKWTKDKCWPDVSTQELLASNYDWISPYLNQVKKPEDLKRIKLHEVLKHRLSFELQSQLDALAPERIKVPSGSMIKLKYTENGDVPVLAVRLQEVFGLEDTPTVCNRQVKVLMHLLSPGFKPVQITGDLKSFWKNAYFEVRKELRSRYPKHEWPEDPSKAEPIRGVKQRRQ